MSNKTVTVLSIEHWRSQIQQLIWIGKEGNLGIPSYRLLLTTHNVHKDDNPRSLFGCREKGRKTHNVLDIMQANSSAHVHKCITLENCVKRQRDRWRTLISSCLRCWNRESRTHPLFTTLPIHCVLLSELIQCVLYTSLIGTLIWSESGSEREWENPSCVETYGEMSPTHSPTHSSMGS